jgi:hypothetical protein
VPNAERFERHGLFPVPPRAETVDEQDGTGCGLAGEREIALDGATGGDGEPSGFLMTVRHENLVSAAR